MQIALVTSVGLDLGTTLTASGVYNLYSGAAFAVPMPVQPMKSIAAVAITDDSFSLEKTLLAGILVSAFVLLLTVTRLVPVAQKVVPDEVIRGIQLGLGLKLSARGVSMVLFNGGAESGGYRPLLGVSGLLVGFSAAVYVLLAVVRPAAGAAATAGGSCCAAAPPPALPTRREASVEKLPPADGALAAPHTPWAAHPTRREASVEKLPPLAASPRRSVDSALAAPLTAPPPRAAPRTAWATARRVAARVPPALLIVCIGLALAAIDTPAAVRGLALGPATPKLLRPQASDWWPAFRKGALPQAPVRCATDCEELYYNAGI